MKKRKDRGTLQCNVVCAYSEPSRCFLTVSAAPFTLGTILGLYKKFSVKNIWTEISRKSSQETGTPALLCFKPEERPADCRITSVINMKYQGTGCTCIFSHTYLNTLKLYINLSLEKEAAN